jgi:hypothetical protein
VRPNTNKKITKPVHKLTDDDLKKLFNSEIDLIDETVNKLDGFNRKIKEVLKRKLRQYLQWKKHTFSELLTRRRFTLQYFRQHYDIIRMYMTWIKPYLRNIRRLESDTSYMDSAHLISSFEGSVMEIETIAKKKYGDFYAVGLMNFLYRTHPSMDYQQEGYQRGPKHSGKVTVTLRAYVWTEDELEDYKQMRQREDLDLLRTLDYSLATAMDALGDEMKAYLAQAGEKLFEEELETKKQKEREEAEKNSKSYGVFEPFIALLGGFKDIFLAFTGTAWLEGKEKKPDPIQRAKNQKSAEKDARNATWRAFKNYRKAHKMITY